MKKFICIALTAFVLTSCLDQGKYNSTDRVLLDFQMVASSNIFNGNDHDYYPVSFQYTSFFFYAGYSKDKVKVEEAYDYYSGGCAIGRNTDTTLVTRTTPFSHYSVFAKPVKEGEAPNYFLIYQDNEDPELNPQAAISYAYSLYGKSNPSTVKIANTTEAVACALGMVPGVTVSDTDWLMVTITGFVQVDEKTVEESGKAEAYLIDNRTVPKKLILEWTELNLETIKDSDFYRISVTSSNPDLPRRVGLDDFSATVTIVL